MSNLDRIWVEVEQQGKVELFKDAPERRGYMVRGDYNAGVVAFYVDIDGRAYPSASSSTNGGCPQLWLESSDAGDNAESTIIFFPEFKDWIVHSASGGKTLSICLIKGWTIQELKCLR